MRTHDRSTGQWSEWRSRVAGGALAILLGLTAYAQEAAAAGPPTEPVSPKAYVGVFKDNAIVVVDTGTNRVLGTIPVLPGPHGIVVTPDGHKVYVSSDGASTVSIIDTATDRVVGAVEVGKTPHGLAISRDGRTLLVAGFGTNQAVLIDTATDQVVGRIPVPQPHNATIGPDGRTAYVASQQQGGTALVVLDLTRQVQVGRIPLDRTPRALDVSQDGKRLYVTLAGSDAVRVFDTSSHSVMAEIPVGASPHYPVFTPGGLSALVVSQGPGELAILDPASGTVSAIVKVGKAPHWIATSGDGRTAYVTNEASNDISVVDLASRTVTATIPVGNAPRKIAVQPGAFSYSPPAAEGPTAPAAADRQSRAQDKLTLSDHGTREVKGLAELDLEADDYYFKPTFLRGEPGQRLNLEVENESGTLHNVSIPSQNIDLDIPPRGKADVVVTFPPSGIVPFFCKFHKALGMSGELQVGKARP
jgi:YVTN family beta-propeller protein